MSWRFDGEGEDLNPPPGGADARVWRWQLVRDDDEKRAVEVWISGTAMSSDDVPPVVENARHTRGRGVVASILDWAEPPARITLDTGTVRPRYEGGDPGPEVAELNEIIEWFDDRGLIIWFTARGGGVGEPPSEIRYTSHSANVVDRTDELVLRVEAPTRLEATRKAKNQWEQKHPELPPPGSAGGPEGSRDRLREFGVHLTISRTSEADDAFYMGVAYDDDDQFLSIAVAPMLEDLWLTIADDVLPDE